MVYFLLLGLEMNKITKIAMKNKISTLVQSSETFNTETDIFMVKPSNKIHRNYRNVRNIDHNGEWRVLSNTVILLFHCRVF